jgi:hypothetical protein
MKKRTKKKQEKAVQAAAAELEGYYIKMFGEVMGPFTEFELRYGVQAREFPEDASYSDKRDGGLWNPVQAFGRPVPPPFTKKVTPPPFRLPPPFRKKAA